MFKIIINEGIYFLKRPGIKKSKVKVVSPFPFGGKDRVEIEHLNGEDKGLRESVSTDDLYPINQ
jgi:hypothetical protein